jgi:hypothetical protein
MLVIEREGKTRNTRLIVLAQGDNQAVTTFYKKVVTTFALGLTIWGS